MAKDYYQILGVEKSATADQIKSAYRKLAKQYHPDLHPDDPVSAEKFKDCNEAYSVLGDEDKRRRYDNGEYDVQGGGAYGNPFGGGYSGSGFDDIFDMFSSFMGGGARRSRTAETVGSDVTVEIELTFMEAAKGCNKQIKFTRVEKCETCGGTGAKDSASVKTCPECNGTGQARYVQNTLFGQSVTIGTCNRCHGTGKIVTNPCKDCHGKGVTGKAKTMNVTIPSGVEDGVVLQMTGEGNAPRGNGRRGNVNLLIRVKPSKIFAREGNNLHVVIPVSFVTATLGGEVEIPSLDGTFIHKLSENTPNGETIRFRGKGVRANRGYVGDLLVTIKVEVPKTLSRAQRKALQEFEREDSIKSYPERKKYLDEVANLYK